MKYKCNSCGIEFDEPLVRKYTENLDGENGIEHRREELCPICGRSDFQDVTEMPEIVLRFRDFIHDGFTAADMQLLQDELDGCTFSDYWRKY